MSFLEWGREMGKGIDGCASLRSYDRLAPHPYGLFACAQSPKFFPRASPTKEFSRPLFSGPTHANTKIKEPL